MDWIKVKVSHVLYEYTDLSDSEFRAWIQIMCLAAIMEKAPSDDVILQHIHSKTLTSLQNKLNKHSTSLHSIVKKVLEDVEYTQHLKEKNRSRIAEYRHKKALCNTLPVTDTEHVTLQGKIREDKIREDKINVTPSFSFDDFWSLYPKQVGMQLAILTFRATVKTPKDFEDLKTALRNYMASEEYKKGYIKNGDKWIEDWRGWLVMTPKTDSPLKKYEVKR
jgi:hypothetical protein